MREQVRRMLHWWLRVLDETLAHARFQVLMRLLRCEMTWLFKAGQTCGVAKTEGVRREILKVYEALWIFVCLEGAEPTNNADEREIRPGVLWRKGSFGTQNAKGFCSVEAMVTAVATP